MIVAALKLTIDDSQGEMKSEAMAALQVLGFDRKRIEKEILEKMFDSNVVTTPGNCVTCWLFSLVHSKCVCISKCTVDEGPLCLALGMP